MAEKVGILGSGLLAAGLNDSSVPPLAMTSNGQAALCISKKDHEDAAVPATASPCPLLADERCSCYEARPLMCRLMFSSTRCETTGHAEIPSPLLSLNTVCLQLVEDADQNGWSGYLVHLLPHFGDAAFAEAYRAGTGRMEDARVRRNCPNPGFLVPPEDHDRIHGWLQDLNRQMRCQ